MLKVFTSLNNEELNYRLITRKPVS